MKIQWLSLIPTLSIALSIALLSGSASAQWPKRPTPGIPRLPDGKANLSAPAPKTADGKPDLSGLWQPPAAYVSNIARDLKNGEVSFQPWAEALYKHRVDTEGKDDPQAYCVLSGVPREDVVPYPFKILNSSGMIVILYEALHSYRQIFMDGRELPKDPNPTWMGYSIGHWDGDTLVVETTGFNDKGWIDNNGHPNTEAMRVTERFHRRDLGHMELKVTIDDPKAYTKPWTVTLAVNLLPDDELLEYVCSENEKDLGHLVGK
jgi:hypothetical protein